MTEAEGLRAIILVGLCIFFTLELVFIGVNITVERNMRQELFENVSKLEIIRSLLAFHLKREAAINETWNNSLPRL